MRKTESRIQRTFEGLFGRTFKGHVQPIELAQKLVKEMEENKVDLLSRAYVPNRFTVFLCRQDREHFRSHEESLVGELETHLLQHARRQKLDLVGPPEVLIVSDDELKVGFFGIRAEQVKPPAPPLSRAAEAALEVERPLDRPLQGLGGGTGFGEAARVGTASPQDTQGISARVADELRLARRALVLIVGDRAREFQQSRVVVGRSRDADLQVDDPNVSRQHAVLYWEGDRVYVKDLGSTNGTLVNGRPITAGPVDAGDTLTVGNSKITVRVS
ncbi:MAG: FhaA domain-containing protein [Thermoleophilia bacterium]